MNRNNFEIEICAGNIQSVIAADKAGANRVELCDNLIEGGTTPSIGTIAVAKDISNIDIFPIIRPRGGNFVYDDIELAIMLQDIKQVVSAGADGIVIGALNNDGSINTDQCLRMMEAAQGLTVTFHRAFDQCKDPFDTLETLISMGVKRVLTSGQKNTAIGGIELLTQLNKQAEDRLKIMPGGGINENNIRDIAKKTGVKSFHASLRDIVQQQNCFWREEVKFNGSGDIKENQVKASDIKKIKRVIQAIQEL